MIKCLIASFLIFCIAFVQVAQAYSPYFHHSFVVTNSAGGTTTQITGSTLGNTANAATPVGTIRSNVQNAAPNTPQAALVSGVPGQVSTRIAAVNLASVALPNLSVPTSGLYTIHREPAQKYLIETDRRFTEYKSYTSSDYLLGRLTLDPQLSQKRLGDGFYEQKLISDQIAQLTGRRFVGQHGSSEDQTLALMNAAVNVEQELRLATGIALSKEQAAALTQDIVWMVEEQITLADGSSTTALVPRVYLSAAHARDLKPDGALIAADVIDINTESSLTNSGTIKSTTASMISARDILNTTATQRITDNRGGNAEKAKPGTAGLSGTGRNTGGLLAKAPSSSPGPASTGTGQISYGEINPPADPAALGNGAYNTLVGAAGSISATETLSLDALNNLTITGANLSAGTDARLKAGNALAVGTIATDSGTRSNMGGNFTTAQTSHLTSTFQAEYLGLP